MLCFDPVIEKIKQYYLKISVFDSPVFIFVSKIGMKYRILDVNFLQDVIMKQTDMQRR